MADTRTKKQRSENMAKIKSVGNKSTEMALVSLLRKNKISGWRRHSKTIIGRPDFIFSKQKIAVFVDGCFWHGCARCGLASKSNKKYWQDKITGNKKRDRAVTVQLKRSGWKVIRIWEHSLKPSNKAVLNVDKIARIMALNKD